MGLFDKFLEKKECGICGKELGLLGKTKLQDGYVCKDCARGLSPFFTRARESTVAQIEQQLAWREKNRERVAAFSPTREIGESWRVLIDDRMGAIIVTNERDWRAANPDVIDFSQVKSASSRLDENRTELYDRDSQGNRVSFRPPRYDYDYNFYMTIGVKHPYFDNIEFRLNDWLIKDRWEPRFRRTEELADEMCRMLRSLNDHQPAAPADTVPVTPTTTTAVPVPTAAAAPPADVMPMQTAAAPAPAFCPNCGAPVTAAAKFCESCGSPLGA